MADVATLLKDLAQRTQEFQVRLDLAEKQRELAVLEERAASPGFWDDQREAQRTLQSMTSLREQVDRWLGIGREIADLQELFAIVDGDLDLQAQIEAQTDALAERLGKMEFDLLLGGQYDANNAILEVSPGAGGIDAQDWAEMLVRMYLRWAQEHRFETEMLDEQPGEEAGIKSVTVMIRGRYAYGYLSSERGTHRLVRLSPFDAAHRRHTSFALVQVMPEVQQDVDIHIDLNDLRIDTYGSTGAGGQHVNKTDSAVRITHRPTGIVVTCQNERSQIQNREVAMNILRARLLECKLEEQAAERAKLRGEVLPAEFGSQIRNYVLHPYTMVKDVRTGVETSNVQAVLDGAIDLFQEAYLRWRVG
ncbi:MAG: peptide chain release factor 2 [Chloroflexi bacterium]|nr:peptide chain release factor 2 [Chloroflexota bacterium]